MRNSIKVIFLLVGFAGIFPGLVAAAEKMNVVATTTTLESIAHEIGGDRIQVHAIASPKMNIHHYAPTPKDVLKVRRAEVLIHEGLDLEAWRGPLLDAAGNLRLSGQSESSIDVSEGIPLIEIPESVSRSEGDIHLFGNPHYIADPVNAKTVAVNIAEGLAKADPDNAGAYRTNAEKFNQALDTKIKEWEARMARFSGAPVVTYHRSWSYFVRRFGLTVIGEIEPKPGIPPTARHIAGLIQQIKEKNVKVMIKEHFEENRTPGKIAAETGAQVVELSQAVGEPEENKDYVSLMERNIRLLEEALRGEKGGTA